MIGGLSGRCQTVWGTLEEVRDGSGDLRGGTGRVGGPLVICGTGWEVWDVSGDPR